MTKEIVDTTNKLIKPEVISKSDDSVIRQLSENLQGITPEDVDTMCEEMDDEKRWYETLWSFDRISPKPRVVCWKLALIVEDTETWKQFLTRGHEIYSGGFEYVWTPVDVWWKPAYYVKENWDRYMMRWKEKISGKLGEKYEFSDPVDIWWKPAYSHRSNWKYCFIRGNKICYDGFDYMDTPVSVGWKPAFFGQKDHRIVVVCDDKYHYCNSILWGLVDVWWKPAFIDSEKEQSWCFVMQGDKRYSGNFDIIGKILDFEWKPAYNVLDGKNEYIMRGDEKYSDNFDHVWYPVVSGWKLAFRAGKNWKYFIVWWNEIYSENFDDCGDPVDVDWKPAFLAKKNGTNFIMRWDEIYSMFDWICWDPIEFNWKPVFVAEKNWKYTLVK